VLVATRLECALEVVCVDVAVENERATRSGRLVPPMRRGNQVLSVDMTSGDADVSLGELPVDCAELACNAGN
jgi:hypothetical protein